MAKKKVDSKDDYKKRIKELRQELFAIYKSREVQDDKGGKVLGALKPINDRTASRIDKIAAEITKLQEQEDNVIG